MRARDQQVDKLRKLLALASSPNVHEAKVARQAADRLMRKRGITEEDVKAADDAGYFEMSLGIKGWNATWRFALVSLAAQVHGVKALAMQRGAKRHVKLCGPRREVGLAHDLYLRLSEIVRDLEVLAAEDGRVVRLARLMGDVSAREMSDAFRRGAVAGIVVVFRRARKRGASEESRPASERVKQDSPASVEVPTSECRELVRVRSLATVSSSDHEEKVREKYSPETKPIDIVGNSDPLLFGLGCRLATAHVEVGTDGEIVFKPRRD